MPNKKDGMPTITKKQWNEINTENKKRFRAIVGGDIYDEPKIDELVRFLGKAVGNFYQNPDGPGYIATVNDKTYTGELIEAFWSGTKELLSQ